MCHVSKRLDQWLFNLFKFAATIIISVNETNCSRLSEQKAGTDSMINIAGKGCPELYLVYILHLCVYNSSSMIRNSLEKLHYNTFFVHFHFSCLWRPIFGSLTICSKRRKESYIRYTFTKWSNNTMNCHRCSSVIVFKFLNSSNASVTLGTNLICCLTVRIWLLWKTKWWLSKRYDRTIIANYAW